MVSRSTIRQKPDGSTVSSLTTRIPSIHLPGVRPYAHIASTSAEYDMNPT